MKQNRILRLPKHGNPNGNRVASAPYNFIPLPETVVLAVENANDLPDHDQYHAERHTGYFEVIMTTKAPLYVRCPFTIDQFMEQEQGKDSSRPFREQVRNTPDFFYTTDPKHPVIPGSSLRGMLRGVLEIVSYSKIQRVTEKRLFFRTVDNTSVGKYYRRRMSNKVETGFLVREGANKFVIKTCEMVRVPRKLLGDTSGNNLYDGSDQNKTPRWVGKPCQWIPVWVKLSQNRKFVTQIKYRHDELPDGKEGFLIITGDVPNKKKEFVFLKPDQDAERVEVSEEIFERFHDDDQITQWQERAFPKDRPSKDCRERNGFIRKHWREVPTHGDPVFFLRENGKLVFFGRAGMFRLPYERSPLSFIPHQLRQVRDVDYAEAIFGYTKGDQIKTPQGDKARAYAGRVFFTDATLLSPSDDIWFSEKSIVPKILSSPKPTAFQHYLVQPEPNNSQNLKHYGSQPIKETVIRGHKRYWFQKNPSRQQIEDQNVPDNSTQHTQFKPLKAGVQFKFRIYFENLSDEELGALCWTLHPLAPENDSKEYCHQLGMGKPLGMGAVKLEATLYLTDRKKRYTALCNGDAWETGVGEPKRLSERTVLQKLVQPFEQHVLRCLQLETHCQHLYQVKRIAMLLKIMEIGANPSARYMPLDGFKKRPVLPDPSMLGGLTGETEPE
jgi:CRISPR-associated protein (TIGR03986 family)